MTFAFIVPPLFSIIACIASLIKKQCRVKNNEIAWFRKYSRVYVSFVFNGKDHIAKAIMTHQHSPATELDSQFCM